MRPVSERLIWQPSRPDLARHLHGLTRETVRVSTGASDQATVPLVRVDVLGPLRLVVGDDVVHVPGPKRRALLALLAMAGGRAVPVDDLLEALWPVQSAETARASLHSQVSRLRHHLGPSTAVLEGLVGAYCLHLDAAQGTDEARVRGLLRRARDHQPEVAYDLLHQARSMWRGAPLAEFTGVAPLTAWAVTFEELRRSVDQAYAQAAVDAGACDEAIEVASKLTLEDPLAEAPALLLIDALRRAGRSADALQFGHEYRTRLREQSGLEPTPALSALEREIAGTTDRDRPGLPRSAGRLRGRDAEMATLGQLLERERLVTIVGPAGVGKTRLATEIARQTDDVAVLWLASVTEAEAIPDTLAAALELRILHGDVVGACAALLGAGRQLLVVDNCEHLLPAVRAIVGELLEACPELTILATSREQLGLPGEQQLRIAPLALRAQPPTGSETLTASRPLREEDEGAEQAISPAVAVFLDRARLVRPGFTADGDVLLLVADIVERLDGIPLAIELAAGRMSSLELTDLHARLDRSLDLLGDGRGLTLRRTIEESYRLLPEPEQRLFRHLSAFPDGFDLATVESVAAEVDLTVDPAAALAHLVDSSMVEATFGASVRYSMLDTIRTFALDELATRGEADGASERFVQWSLNLATEVGSSLSTEDEPTADRMLRRELGNLRAAWRRLQTEGRRDQAIVLILGIGEAAGWRELTEIWAWTLELADDPALEGHPAASTVLGMAADVAWSRGELERAEQLGERGLLLDDGGSWRCLSSLALVSLSRGDFAVTVERATQAAAMAPSLDQTLGIAALAAAYGGDLDGAVVLNAELATSAPSPTLRSFNHYVAGEIEALRGAPGIAEEHYREAIALARTSGATFAEGLASVGLTTLHARSGRVLDALVGYAALVEYWATTGSWIQQWTTLRNLADLLASLGDPECAEFLRAAADHAPDAPPVDSDRAPSLGHVPVERAAEVRADATTASRSHVLGTARSAIERHRAALSTR
jgi:predicted ATPase/DNA-binding SARP family transcriptional activator